jgi:hypothetical protein
VSSSVTTAAWTARRPIDRGSCCQDTGWRRGLKAVGMAGLESMTELRASAKVILVMDSSILIILEVINNNPVFVAKRYLQRWMCFMDCLIEIRVCVMKISVNNVINFN